VTGAALQPNSVVAKERFVSVKEMHPGDDVWRSFSSFLSYQPGFIPFAALQWLISGTSGAGKVTLS
jgi:hypothetical protein